MRSEPMSKLQRETKAVTEQVVTGKPVTIKKSGKDYIVMMTPEEYNQHLQNEEILIRQKADAHDELMHTLNERYLAHESDPKSGYTIDEMHKRHGLGK